MKAIGGAPGYVQEQSDGTLACARCRCRQSYDCMGSGVGLIVRLVIMAATETAVKCKICKRPWEPPIYRATKEPLFWSFLERDTPMVDLTPTTALSIPITSILTKRGQSSENW